jgi:hypothetical protein
MARLEKLSPSRPDPSATPNIENYLFALWMLSISATALLLVLDDWGAVLGF